MKSVVVCPVLDGNLYRRLYDSADMGPSALFQPIVDHKSVAGAWNRGRSTVLSGPYEYLTLISEAVVFGEQGGADWLRALDGGEECVNSTLGWKLVAIRRDVLDKVGPFDEQFVPAYWEDTDYLYRMHLAGFASPRENDRPGFVWWDIDATVPEGDGHALQAGTVVNMGLCAARYEAKWGGAQGSETFHHPYGDISRKWDDVRGAP